LEALKYEMQAEFCRIWQWERWGFRRRGGPSGLESWHLRLERMQNIGVRIQHLRSWLETRRSKIEFCKAIPIDSESDMKELFANNKCDRYFNEVPSCSHWEKMKHSILTNGRDASATF
jgi:hypothetical protein